MKSDSRQGLHLSDLLLITTVFVVIAFFVLYELYAQGIGVKFWNQIGSVIDVIYTREGMAFAAAIGLLFVLAVHKRDR